MSQRLISSQPTPNVTEQSAHSPRFEDWAVALPQHLKSPVLRQLGERLSAVCPVPELSTDTQIDTQIDTQNDTHNDITQALRVRDWLTHTAVSDASVLVALTNEACPRLLLTRRASHLNAHAGEVSFPGGKHEEGDTGNVMTALRESCEETALPPSRVQLIGQLPTQVSKSGLVVRPIVAVIEPNLTLVPELGEIARIFWADFEALINQPTSEFAIDYDHAGKSVTIVTPSWQVDGETVWGLTGRIVASLLEIGFDRQVDWYYRVQGQALDW